MEKIAIKADGVSKAYQLGSIGTGTIGNDLRRWYASVRGKEDPFLKVGESNDRTVKSKSNIVWSLKDISFEIKQGDAVGIIGRNGAGKSTLLKILSKVTGPTTGKISGTGRIASLLEVGTGFHPELTGKENIYLNGAILGMRKKEIKRKFDEIVSFSGVERYIDTPVKRYSSGMYVRLAFAVAAHLESEILIVDEVLAVGDAEFQKKCLGKMGEVSKGEGRTVLFVSHQMNAIESLCNTTIYLDKGMVHSIGEPNHIIGTYLRRNDTLSNVWVNKGGEFQFAQFTPSRFSAVNENYTEAGVFSKSERIGIQIEGDTSVISKGFCLGFALFNSAGQLIFWSYNIDKKENDWVNVDLGHNKIIAWIPSHLLNEGEYRVELMSSIHYIEWQCHPEVNAPSINFEIKGGLSESPLWIEARPGINAPILDYEKVKS